MGNFIQAGIEGKDRDRTKRFLSTVKPFSIVLLSRDFDDLQDLKALLKWIRRLYRIELGIDEPFIAVDQEGGNVARIREIDYLPSNFAMGVMGIDTYSRYSGLIAGYQLMNLGIRWNLAPVLDTASNVDNHIVMERSFGQLVDLVGKLGLSYIEGLQGMGVAATAKHFPGHGYVLEDSHEKLPHDHREINSVFNGALPFKLAAKNGVRATMASHIVYDAIDPDLPASLSSKVYEILRKDFGFEGLAITDSLDMKAISSNFSVREISGLVAKGGPDVIECVDMDMAREFFEELNKKTIHQLQNRTRRIENLIPERKFKFSPPSEVMNWISAGGVRWLRRKNLSPERSLTLIFLNSTFVAEKSWPFKLRSLIEDRIKQLDINLRVTTLDSHRPIRNDQIIIIGKNLHLGEKWQIIGRICEGNDCVFLSTGMPVDSGLLDKRIGYIYSGGEKYESIIAAIFVILGFFDPFVGTSQC